MLRVAFNCPTEQKLRAVIEGLTVLSERLRRPADRAFTMYNHTPSNHGAGVNMVEIHNDPDNVFSCALDQVILSIQRTSSSMDDELLRQSNSKRVPSVAYHMLKGRLFSAVPAALGFIVRQASPVNDESPPVILRFHHSGEKVASSLDVLSKMADLALGDPGVVACLIQGMGSHANDANLLLLFASDRELYGFLQNQQAQLLGATATRTLDDVIIKLDGTPSTFAQQAVSQYLASLGK